MCYVCFAVVVEWYATFSISIAAQGEQLRSTKSFLDSLREPLLLKFSKQSSPASRVDFIAKSLTLSLWAMEISRRPVFTKQIGRILADFHCQI